MENRADLQYRLTTDSLCNYREATHRALREQSSYPPLKGATRDDPTPRSAPFILSAMITGDRLRPPPPDEHGRSESQTLHSCKQLVRSYSISCVAKVFPSGIPQETLL